MGGRPGETDQGQVVGYVRTVLNVRLLSYRIAFPTDMLLTVLSANCTCILRSTPSPHEAPLVTFIYLNGRSK